MEATIEDLSKRLYAEVKEFDVADPENEDMLVRLFEYYFMKLVVKGAA